MPEEIEFPAEAVAPEPMPLVAEASAVPIETVISAHAAVEHATQPAITDVRQRWFEVCLVLFISCGSFILYSLYSLGGRWYAVPLTRSPYIYNLLQEVLGLLLLAYVLSRRNLSFKDIGLRWSFQEKGKRLLDPAAALFLVCVSYAAYGYAYSALHPVIGDAPGYAAGLHSYGMLFPSHYYVIIPLTLLNPFFEELIVRAYLMTEVRQLTGSWVPAVLISVIFQTSYHLYQGWLLALSLATQFLVFSVFFARTQRIAPVIVAHGFFDILALVMPR
jgi:membrane protease YdiL (CAAX protease family)